MVIPVIDTKTTAWGRNNYVKNKSLDYVLLVQCTRVKNTSICDDIKTPIYRTIYISI